MKNKTFTLIGLLICGFSSFSQVVGDASISSVNFNNSSLLYQGTSQAYPKVVINSSVKSVIWGTDVAPNILRHTTLNPSYIGTTSSDVISTSGNLNSQAYDLQHAICFDTLTGKYLSVYKHNYDQPLNEDYSLKAKLYDDNTFTSTSFNIEGPFTSSSVTPSMPSIAVSSNSIFCVAYHSSLTNSTSSKVKVKFVDANTSAVTPASVSGTQNGIDLTFVGAQWPSVAWNENAGVFGVVYVTGTGNSQKIKFVTCDESGNVVTAQQDLIADNSIQVQFPHIYADGNDFVITWRDYRQITIGNNPAVSGIPSLRIAQIDATGNLKTLTGSADIFDASDNSLLLSNPYNTEVYLYSDLKVIVPGQKYAVVWATQNVVNSIEFTTVEVTGTNIKAGIAHTISLSGQQSYAPTLDYDFSNSTYVVAYYENNGIHYENRICSGVQCVSSSATDVQSACDSYTWIDGNTYTTSNSTATHTILGVATNGCDSVYTLNLTINSADNSVTQTGATLTSNQSSATYQWVDCDNGNAPIPGETNQTFTASANGNYAVEITTGNGCTATSTCYAVTGVSLNENSASTNGIKLYPNPTNGNFTINLGENNSKSTIQIIDLTGKVVFENTYSNQNQINLDLQAPKGIYFVKVMSNGQLSVVKLIKQ